MDKETYENGDLVFCICGACDGGPYRVYGQEEDHSDLLICDPKSGNPQGMITVKEALPYK